MTEDCGYSFIKFPRALIDNPSFSSVSIESRFLFALILDRMYLSEMNYKDFTDENGRIYVIYTIDEVCGKIGCGKSKILRMFNELEQNGLIIRKRKISSMPYKIYIPNYILENLKQEVRTSENQTSALPKSEPAQVSESDHSNTENINNDKINTYPSIVMTDDEIREQIEYDCIVHEDNQKMLDEIVLIMADVYNGLSDTVRIGKEVMRREGVIKRFLSLDSEHIEFVISNIESNTAQIKNIRSYLITMLYNAPATMEAWINSIFAYYHKN